MRLKDKVDNFIKRKIIDYTAGYRRLGKASNEIAEMYCFIILRGHLVFRIYTEYPDVNKKVTRDLEYLGIKMWGLKSYAVPKPIDGLIYSLDISDKDLVNPNIVRNQYWLEGMSSFLYLCDYSIYSRDVVDGKFLSDRLLENSSRYPERMSYREFCSRYRQINGCSPKLEILCCSDNIREV